LIPVISRQTKHLYELDALRLDVRLKTHPEKMRLRSQLVEHPFGTMKRGMNQGYFLLRGLKKVAAEMSLTVLCYNLKRALNVLGVRKLLGALT
jgi:Transposase DDE domain